VRAVAAPLPGLGLPALSRPAPVVVLFSRIDTGDLAARAWKGAAGRVLDQFFGGRTFLIQCRFTPSILFSLLHSLRYTAATLPSPPTSPMHLRVPRPLWCVPGLRSMCMSSARNLAGGHAHGQGRPGHKALPPPHMADGNLATGECTSCGGWERYRIAFRASARRSHPHKISWPTVLCRKACRRQNVACLRTLAPLLNFRGDAAVAAMIFPVEMPSSKRWQARAGRAEPMPSPCIGAQMHQESIHKFRRGRGLRSATAQRSACIRLRQHYGFVSDVVWLAAVGSWGFLPPRPGILTLECASLFELPPCRLSRSHSAVPGRKVM
jgi:hypothetical protein